MVRIDYLNLDCCSFSLVVFPIFGFVLLLAWDDPPILPLSNSPDFAIDGQNVFAEQIASNGTRFKFTVSIGISFYFREKPLRFLRVIVRTGDIIVEHRMPDFLDMHEANSTILFTVTHALGRIANAAISCHAHPLEEITTQIASIDGSPVGYARAFASQHIVARMHNCSYADDTIHYFTQSPTVCPAFRLANDSFVSIFHRQLMSTYIHDHPHHIIYQMHVIFISVLATSVWRQLSDVIIPLWAAIQQYPHTEILRVRSIDRNSI
jgi:hypothetical protein